MGKAGDTRRTRDVIEVREYSTAARRPHSAETGQKSEGKLAVISPTVHRKTFISFVIKMLGLYMLKTFLITQQTKLQRKIAGTGLLRPFMN